MPIEIKSSTGNAGIANRTSVKNATPISEKHSVRNLLATLFLAGQIAICVRIYAMLTCCAPFIIANGKQATDPK
jgi:hypothetical protein